MSTSFGSEYLDALNLFARLASELAWLYASRSASECKRLAFRTSQAEAKVRLLGLSEFGPLASFSREVLDYCMHIQPKGGNLDQNTKQRHKNLDLMTVYGLVCAHNQG